MSKTKISSVPDHVIEELARCFLPDIIAFYEVEENRKAFEEWKNENESKPKKKAT